MKKLIVLLLTVCILAPLNAQRSREKADTRLDGIDVRLQGLLKDWNTAGFAVAVVEKDKIVYARGFGYRDYEEKLPVTPNTLFAIGSCTKAFTAALIGIIADEKKVELTESPANYIPGLKFFNREMDNMITISDMMCHRTGLPRHDYSWYLFPSPSKDELIERIRYQEPTAGVRQVYQYNNFMFFLQGAIIENVSGKRWEDNVTERLFTPLGMTRSNFTIEAMEKSDDASLGYTVKDDSMIILQDYYQIEGLGAAGTINSSVTEMSAWLMTWINGGKYEGKQIIPSSFVQSAISSQMVASPGLPTAENSEVFIATYGYAWMISSYRGHYRVQHGGNIDGFSALTVFYPTDSLGIVVLANQDGSSLPSLVRNIISDRMLRLPEKDWNKLMIDERDKAAKAQKDAMAKARSDRKEGTSLSHSRDEYTGSYNHPGYGTLKVVVSGDSLFMKFPTRRMWLKHYHYDVFEVFEAGKDGIDTTAALSNRVNFRTGNDGEIESFMFTAEPTLKALEFRRKPEVIDLDAKALVRFAGDYELAGIVAKVYTKNENTLYLFVPGQPEYELEPLGPVLFGLKNVEGFRLEFTEDDKGVIKSLIFIQPNGRFEAIKKTDQPATGDR
jgi:CubicO group peptidase (beta-lactamase class C family)